MATKKNQELGGRERVMKPVAGNFKKLFKVQTQRFNHMGDVLSQKRTPNRCSTKLAASELSETSWLREKP